MDYKLTVGLEIHAELKTRTKMFCSSRNDADEARPNVNICPICLGYPGTLPIINKEAVRSVLRLGASVGGELAAYTEFDRKNYFYPDIPKGYQISQYKHPLVSGGELAGVKLTRIHLEEDTAKSTHTKDGSLVDFNRAGVPLVELVTEPEIHDAETAGRFAREFQLLLTYLGIAHANMEKGEMRIEANISVGTGELGTKVEIKNLNSFKSVERAIKFEMERQIAVLEKGEKVVQETRGWDEERGETISQRAKEESHDYRYFPDPDLPKLFINEIPDFAPEVLRRAMPELPWEKRRRLLKSGISKEHADIYTANADKEKEFKLLQALTENQKYLVAGSNYIINEIKKPVQASVVLQVAEMVEKGNLSSKGAKEIFKSISETETDARIFAEKNNLMQISDKETLKKFAEEAVAENKNAPIQFLVGQVIKKSGGRANPVVAQELLLDMLDR